MFTVVMNGQRIDGLYWVRPKVGEWTVARYVSEFRLWNIVGASDTDLPEDHWAEIGERIDPAPV